MCSKAVAHTKSDPDLRALLSFSRTIKTTTLATLQKNVSTASGITPTPGQIVNDHTFQTQDISHCFNSVTPTTPPYPDILLHVFVTAKEAFLGLGVHRNRLAHSDGATTNHGVKQLGLSAQWCALVGDVDTVRVFWTRMPKS